MPRGAIVLVIQLFVSAMITAVGFCALLLPKRLQRFMNTNYALLPAPTEGWRLTAIALRLVGVFLIWYGYTLIGAYRAELLWLAHIFGIM